MADLYALQPDPELPGLPGEPVIRESPEELLDVLAADVYLHALNCVQNFGDFHMAIAVGPFQERLCRRLMTDPAVRELPWKRTHLWAVHDEPDPMWGSRFTSIADLLEDHSGIPDSNIHLPDLDAPDPAADYERRFQERLAWREKGHDRLDLAILHLAPDGLLSGEAGEHGDPVDPGVLFTAREIGTWNAGSPAGLGLAMTPKLLNATRLVAIAALGADCRQAVAGAKTNASVPTPMGGSLRWYVDRAACAQ